MTRAGPGYIYAVSNVAWPGFLKLGSSTNVRRRLMAYQTGDPFRAYRLEFAWTFPCRRAAEGFLHETFAARRCPRNEWFRVTLDEVVSALVQYLETP